VSISVSLTWEGQPQGGCSVAMFSVFDILSLKRYSVGVNMSFFIYSSTLCMHQG
jgi:hypothetical protein